MSELKVGIIPSFKFVNLAFWAVVCIGQPVNWQIGRFNLMTILGG
jgi:hypothetical protein